MSVNVAIIKPAGNGCNMQCDYCYAGGNINKIHNMPVEMAKKIVDEMMSQKGIKEDRIEFLWHGGEPLLRGIDFFKEVFEYQKKKYQINGTQKYINAIQSNLTLFNDEWIQFFLDYDIPVSTSLDGNKLLHNEYRKFANGKGSYDLIVNKIKHAQSAGLIVNILVVISKTNMNCAQEIFNMINNLNIHHVGFLTCFLSENGTLKYPSLEPGDFAKFLIPFFELYTNEPCSFTVREFEQLLSGSVRVYGGTCSFAGNCQNFICINSNGDVYACDTSPLSNEYRFGNISNQNLEEILSSPQRSKLLESYNVVPDKCLSCDYHLFCNNGCYNMRINNGQYLFCKDRKLLYEYMLGVTRQVIRKRKCTDCQ